MSDNDGYDEEPDPDWHTEAEIQAWRDAHDADPLLRELDADLDRRLAVEVTKALVRAAAHADDVPLLLDAIAVQTAALDRVTAIAVIYRLTVRIAALTKAVDDLTGSLERATGTGSIERITNALERPANSDDDPPPTGRS